MIFLGKIFPVERRVSQEILSAKLIKLLEISPLEMEERRSF
jgi:hypothetical protein